MAEAYPIHVVSSRAERRERLMDAASPASVTAHETLEGALAETEEGPCVLLVDPGPDGSESIPALLEVCRDVADEDQKKIVFLVGEDDGVLVFRPLSVGFPVNGDDLDDVLDPEGETWPPFELHEILRFVARIRHDINNPLTAGMAETQLLLMDHGEEGELGESLVTIQRQLKRIQGLVQDLAHLRRPGKRPKA